ncbi:SGNH/GDSL hydrolase family protein [Candidatus Curtissbacteria bacterium]|nr:SGNH/GDSL hydrolase family protein [Candidatus Curtissbacteria bacterium]
MFLALLIRLIYFLKDFSSYLVLIILSLLILIFATFKIYKSGAEKKKKQMLLASIFTLFAIILIFTGFEAYFRYVYDVPDGLGYLKVNRKWHERHVIHNNYFFRDRDFVTNKKEGITRIAVLGDSIAFGGGIEKVEDRFSNRLEKKLREAGKNVEVYNLGKPGYDTEAEIVEYGKVEHLNFDIVVWEYFLNDIQPKDKSTGTPIISQNSQKGKIVTFLSDRSFFFDFVYWRFSQRYQKTFQALRIADLNQYKNQQVLEDHKRIIDDFAKDLEKENVKTFVIIFPSTFLLGPNYPANDIHKMMGEYFQELGLQTLDLLPDLIELDRNKLMASKFDPHPNEIVHNLAAQKLFERINAYLSSP